MSEKHSIEFCSVAFRCKYEHQYGETRGKNDQETHLVQSYHTTTLRYPGTLFAILKVCSNVRLKLCRPQGDDVPDIDVTILDKIVKRICEAVVRYIAEIDPESEG